MRCHICDSILDDVRVDKDNLVLPCEACNQAIKETVEAYELYGELDDDFDPYEYPDS